jgi:hypothetical protein
MLSRLGIHFPEAGFANRRVERASKFEKRAGNREIAHKETREVDHALKL